LTRTQRIWLISLVLYGLFFGWYTSLGGPLSEGEISHFMEIIGKTVPAPSPERLAQLRRFMEEDTGDDFVMVNLLDLYDTPLQVEGVMPGETSEEVMAKYMSFMIPELISRASHPVLYGSAASSVMDIMNAEGMEVWKTGAGMRYRSRRDMLEISTNPAFRGSHEFKIAALRKTIAFPIDPWVQLGDPRLILALLLVAIASGLSWREAVRTASLS
jgi:hypothetical protein